MRSRRTGSGRLVPIGGFAVLIAAIAALGLLGDEPVETDVEPLGTVAVVPEATTGATEPIIASEVDSPWCAALLALDRADGPVGEELATAYRSIAVGAPEVLAADLLGAADLLEAGAPPSREDPATPPSTAEGAGEPSLTLPDDFDAEGRPFEDDPRVRVAVYIEGVCRATGSNPGPPPTQPALEPDDTLADGP